VCLLGPPADDSTILAEIRDTWTEVSHEMFSAFDRAQVTSKNLEVGQSKNASDAVVYLKTLFVYAFWV
jgi:hypothetical protein